MPIEASNLLIFIESTAYYFSQITGEPADVAPPFLRGDDQYILDYTGVIGISGKQKGAVYFTAPLQLLTELIRMSGIKDPPPDLAADAVGEVANTISGNARRQFGSEFLISVPVVLTGRPDSIQLGTVTKHRSFVIPISWRGHKAYLVVSLE